MADAHERDSYSGERPSEEGPALGDERPAVAVAETREASADLGAAVEQVRDASVLELAADCRRLSAQLSETELRLQRAEADRAHAELARARAEGRARDAERIAAEAAERAAHAERRREQTLASAAREREVAVALAQQQARAELREARERLRSQVQKVRGVADRLRERADARAGGLTERAIEELRRGVAEEFERAGVEVREEADRALAKSRRELDTEARCREDVERELIAARARLVRLAQRAARRTERPTRKDAETELSEELTSLERETEETSPPPGNREVACSRAATGVREGEVKVPIRQAEEVEKERAEAEQRSPERTAARGNEVGRPPTADRRPDDEMSHRRLVAEAWVTGAALLLTVLTFGGFLVNFGATLQDRLRSPLGVAAAVVFLLIVGFLVYGGLVYLLSRLGYMRRRARFRHAGADELQRLTAETDARVSVLIPSYKEEPGVVRQTLLSAALQEYPHRRVVLLIDDPPDPSSAEQARSLAAARELPGEVNALLARAREPFAEAAERAERRALEGRLDRRRATGELADLYWRAAAWFRTQAALRQLEDHASSLFVEMNLREPARRHAATAASLRDTVAARGGYPTEEMLLRSYRELAGLFAAEVTSFERKRYANLSHAPNKAMNLNSYIALMGRRMAEKPTRDGRTIHDVSGTEPGFDVPDAEYVLTLDADSLLEPRYTVRLVHFLEREENSRIAVAQTPYSAIPDATCSIERMAGATTDIQYVIHQGFTAHGATYWVGANALLRKRALEDIATAARDEGTGAEVVRYIQDRTVIEDTESSIDLVDRGWGLFNYPARLSYSATPPDFGSLVVQRRRWANGGLLILPRLLRIILRRSVRLGPIHAFMRFHYLVSITAVNMGLVILFLVPFADWYANAWLPLTAAPYFALYTHDLRLAGYRAVDVVRVYALNLMLVPVNLGGVARSLWQAITGRGTPFLRTPKVRDRTTAPALYVVLPYLLIFLLLFGGTFSVINGHALTGAASGVNALLLLYAVGAFIGWRHSREDLSMLWKRMRLLRG